MNFDDLKNRIESNIYQNSEEAITGEILQNILIDIIDTSSVTVQEAITESMTEIDPESLIDTFIPYSGTTQENIITGDLELGQEVGIKTIIDGENFNTIKTSSNGDIKLSVVKGSDFNEDFLSEYNIYATENVYKFAGNGLELSKSNHFNYSTLSSDSLKFVDNINEVETIFSASGIIHTAYEPNQILEIKHQGDGFTSSIMFSDSWSRLFMNADLTSFHDEQGNSSIYIEPNTEGIHAEKYFEPYNEHYFVQKKYVDDAIADIPLQPTPTLQSVLECGRTYVNDYGILAVMQYGSGLEYKSTGNNIKSVIRIGENGSGGNVARLRMGSQDSVNNNGQAYEVGFRQVSNSSETTPFTTQLYFQTIGGTNRITTAPFLTSPSNLGYQQTLQAKSGVLAHTSDITDAIANIDLDGFLPLSGGEMTGDIIFDNSTNSGLTKTHEDYFAKIGFDDNFLTNDLLGISLTISNDLNVGTGLSIQKDAFSIYTSNGENSTSISSGIDDSNIVISSNNEAFEGLSYSNDYSLNYTERSLVDKAYVDDAIESIDAGISTWQQTIDKQLETNEDNLLVDLNHGIEIEKVEGALRIDASESFNLNSGLASIALASNADVAVFSYDSRSISINDEAIIFNSGEDDDGSLMSHGRLFLKGFGNTIISSPEEKMIQILDVNESSCTLQNNGSITILQNTFEGTNSNSITMFDEGSILLKNDFTNKSWEFGGAGLIASELYENSNENQYVQRGNLNDAILGVSFIDLQDKPNSIAGYGITDAVSTSDLPTGANEFLVGNGTTSTKRKLVGNDFVNGGVGMMYWNGTVWSAYGMSAVNATANTIAQRDGNGRIKVSNALNSNDACTLGQLNNAVSALVRLNGNDTLTGVKTFSSSPVVPDAVNLNQAVNFGQLQSTTSTAWTNGIAVYTVLNDATWTSDGSRLIDLNIAIDEAVWTSAYGFEFWWNEGVGATAYKRSLDHFLGKGITLNGGNRITGGGFSLSLNVSSSFTIPAGAKLIIKKQP